MRFYIVIINGLDLIITGPFIHEELATAHCARISVFEHKHVVRISTSIGQHHSFQSWEDFQKEWITK